MLIPRRQIFALALMALLAACSSKPIATSPIATSPPMPALAQPTAASATPAPLEPTPEPTMTVTFVPSATASPATLTPLPSPAAATRPASDAAVAASPTTVIPTAAADALLASARWHQTIGDCDRARRELAELLAGQPAPAVAAEARYRMAQCYARDDAPAEAMVTLSELLATAPGSDPYRPPAQFLFGEALATLGRWQDAEAAYVAYLPLAPELAYLTQQRIAAARRVQGNLTGAAEAYRAALTISPDWTNTTAIRRALADLALEQGAAQEAVAQYDALRGQETQGAWAAEMYYLSANALAKGALAAIFPAATPTVLPGPPAVITVTPTLSPVLAQTIAAAQKRWQAAVDADVTGRYVHSAIVALLDSGAAVDEYQRGVANYANGTYELAIAAFDRLRAADPAGRDGLAWYYAGLSHLALGDADRGIAELDALINTYPNSSQAPDAWMAKARSQAKAGQTAAAIATYRKLAEVQPAAPQAPKALWQVAILQDLEPPVAAATAPYLDLARRYPRADEAWRAYQNAGLIYFRLSDWRRAAEVWREMAGKAELPAFTRPVAHFWLGRALQAAGDTSGAQRAWQDAVQAGPESFYGLRAAAWLAGKGVEASMNDGAPPAQSISQPGADANEIAAWLATWAGPGTLDWPAAVRDDGDWQRGQMLLRLGRRVEALANWGRVQKRYSENPWTLAALALAFHDAGAHRLALLSAEQVVGLSGKLMRDAPPALQRLAYPFPLADLVNAEATRQNLDPRLLAAIIRQESRFEAGAASVAGAQGLMQVMPGTAQGIAQQMRWPGFEPRQAYWPYVNVAFGAFYVRQWVDHFGGSVFTALAAYNGGPGNATVWYNWAPEDDDLLAALININETRVYVQAVWANYEAYRRLYP